ncbi:MAG TPA: hypothetical protein VFL87_05030 [Thermoleophilaceae bacterium]|nr:hypothetical protein [Thermoleophilaceae bacterium]
MGTALLILLEIFGWGIAILIIGAVLEAGFSRIRRRRKQTLID